MLDPRIYRTGLMVVVVTVIVVAFSLGNQASPLTTTLVPDAFDGDAAYATMQSLARQYPDRPPGSEADGKIADYVAGTLGHDGFAVQRSEFEAQTVDGPRTIENVVGTLAGTSPGTIVVVAHRDSVRASPSGSAAEESGTAVLLELAAVLSQQTQQRSIVLASTSGHVGAAGAAQLARTLPGPVDGVIVLGDVAGPGSPSVVPWSDSQLVAPAVLRNTLAAAVSQQTGVNASDESLGGEFLHLAFPLAATEQSPFVGAGQPAVLVSASGGRLPSPDQSTSPARIDAFGRAILESVSALEAGPTVAPPTSYLRWSGKLIPVWAVRLLVLALIVPVLVATIDGLARARRRGYRVARWVVWVLSASLPFVLAVLAIVGLRAVGAIDAAPPGPVGGDALTLSGRAVAILAGLACLIVAGLVIRWRVVRHLWAATPAPVEPPANGDARTRSRRATVVDDPASPGAAAALMIILCVVALVMWLGNPFAAALLVPALHAWMWIVAPERRPAAPWAVLLFVAGLVPGVLAAVYYAAALGLGAAPAAWNAVLMQAGGSVSVISAIEWSVVLGCVISLGTMILRIARQPRQDPADLPITVRGPITYAGPGSLGGTRSALRR
ncbi:MAG TPA: M28 family peptidase [Solirubrobacteraceae bacterium]|nr:M28 family peptidase [Solirubrobacteraceae bacterium]